MQIIQDDGTTRALEDYELAALAAAQAEREAEDASRGIYRQYTQEEAVGKLLGIVANEVEVPLAEAVRMRSVFPQWEAGASYPVGYRVAYGDSLWRCLQAHTSQEDWLPTTAPSLWAKVLAQTDPETGEDVISEWEQPGSTNPYGMGDRVTHDGHTWVSTTVANVWEPGMYGWDPVD